MNDVKEICQVALEEPAPPLREADEVLAIARRAAVRHNRVRWGVLGLAATTAATAVAVAPVIAGRTGGPATRLGEAGPVAAPAPQPPAVPGADGADAHGPTVARLLIGAVPAGFATRPWPGDRYAASTWRVESPGNGYLSSTYVVVSDGSREGMLSASIHADNRAVPAGDLCAADVLARIAVASPSRCEVVTVGGAPVVVTTSHEDRYGDVVAATRFLRDGYLTVRAAQAVPAFDDDGTRPPDARRPATQEAATRPPLAVPPLTAPQVAALAGNPAMLP